MRGQNVDWRSIASKGPVPNSALFNRLQTSDLKTLQYIVYTVYRNNIMFPLVIAETVLIL